jgi:DNA-binding transcriptional regulator YiaG
MSQSNSGYKGDSPGKKVARLRVWLNIRAIAQALEIPYTGALVLAGEGGDISVLESFGIDLETVVAVDYDPFLIEWCKNNHPDVLALVGEAGEMSSVADYSAAHLDFCGSLRNGDNPRTLAHVAANANVHPAVIAVTMQKCREDISGKEHEGKMVRGLGRPLQREMHALAVELNDPVGQHLFRGNRFDARVVLAHAEQRLRRLFAPHGISQELVDHHYFNRNGTLGNLGHALIRADGLRWCAEWLIKAWVRAGIVPDVGEPLVIRLVGTLTYHSITEHSGGQPFFTAIFVVAKASQEAATVMAIQKADLNLFDSWTIEESQAHLEPTALEMARHLPDEKVAQMFDVTEQMVRKWKEDGALGDPLFHIEDVPLIGDDETHPFWGRFVMPVTVIDA